MTPRQSGAEKGGNQGMDTPFSNELLQFRRQMETLLESPDIRETVLGTEFPAFMEPYLSAFFDLNAGGKRVRAYLVKLGFALCGGTDTARILPAALSYEIFQTGILIHDDIIDDSPTRRNLPTLHVRLGGDRDAVSKAICMGDVGIINAFGLLARAGFDGETIRRAIRRQQKVYNLTIAGELKDIELSGAQTCNMADIIQMYELKTAWYTMIGPMQLGAILGGAPQRLLDEIERAGLAMGTAFQIRDDILGIFADTGEIGKSNLSDMQEGKTTVLTQHFQEHASDTQRARFRRIYGRRESGAAELTELRQLLQETGSDADADARCQTCVETARRQIAQMEISDANRAILWSFLDYLTGRTR